MTQESKPDNRIAIVGRAGRFPASRNVEEFWDLISSGRVGTTKLSDQALLAAGVSRAALADPNYVKAANILPEMESFDAGFFGFSPREAAILDPQHRHFLETCWEVLEDAGHVPESFDGRIGIYAGSGMQAYLPYNLLSNPDLVEEIGLFLLRHTGNDKDFLTTRASYILNLTGPSVAVQTACSTSLVAVHMAVNALLSYECDMALAGGVTIELPHRVGYKFAKGEILSPDGYCRAFDEASEGTVFGSGSALVALRRMEDALADGDDIKAVILGSAINNDGSSKANYLAPSVEGQAEAAGEAVAIAQVEPKSISYIEAHGTGTPIGDPIELEALNDVYGPGDKSSIDIGSVKSNIGHLDTAAGVAGLIKIVEAMRHRFIPATANFSTPNSRFDFSSSPFQVSGEGKPWRSEGRPRRAAINSLGVGGTNAHVIIEEAPERPETPAKDCWRVFPFSARDDAALARGNENWASFLEQSETRMGDVAHTLINGRRAFPARMAVAARTNDDLLAALTGAAPALLQTGKSDSNSAASIVFMYPGGGAQYPGAGAEILQQSPVFKAAVDECFSLLPASAPDDLYEVMFLRTLADDDARDKLSTKSAYAIPALTILGYAYTKQLESWGIKPDSIVAHSAGEYAGAVVSGAMTLRDALRVVTLRGQVMDDAPKGAMTTIPADEATVRKLVGDNLDIAALNAPEVSVISGHMDEIAALEKQLCETEHAARRIPLDVAAHSRLLDGQLDRFRKGFEGIKFGTPTLPMVSALRGGWGIEDDFISAEYWVRHLRNTVRFADAISCVLEKPDQIIIDMGPSQSLLPLVQMIPGANPPRGLIPCAPKPKDETSEIGVSVAALGGLWANGVELDWQRLPGQTGRKISLPTYPFDKTKHWIEPGKQTAAKPDEEELPNLHRREDIDTWLETTAWVEEKPAGSAPEVSGSWVVFANQTPFANDILTALQKSSRAQVTVVSAGDAYRQSGNEFEIRTDVAEDYEKLLEALGDGSKTMLQLWPLETTDTSAPFDHAYLLLRAMQLNGIGPNSKLAFVVPVAPDAQNLVSISPDMQSLIGPVRVAPREIPGLEAALIGIDPTSARAQDVIAEAASADAADELAYLNQKRLIPQRSPSSIAASKDLPGRLKRGGVYVVTGGLGGIGRELALWLAKTTHAKIAMMSRSAQDDHALTEAIRKLGGDVAYFAVDVTDKTALTDAIEQTKAKFGTINGVIHAAGAIADAPFSVKSLDEAHTIMAPKIIGAQNLAELLPDGSIDLFAVFSSSSVVIGPAGQSDYIAANAYLEALAAERSDGLSIAWSIWRDIGMAAETYGVGSKSDSPYALLGSRQPDENGAVVYSGRLDPMDDWVIAEHIVGDTPVLPGTAYLEIAAEAAKDQFGTVEFEIQSLSLAAPMVFTDSAARNVDVHLTPSDEGFDLRITSSGGTDKPPVEHANARIEPRQKGSPTPGLPDFVAPETLAPRSGKTPQEVLIDFGPRWNNIGEIRIDQKYAEGQFTLPDAFLSDLETGIHLHPALVDMAMTVGLHLIDASEMEGNVYVPISFEHVSVLAPVPAKIISRAVRRDTAKKSIAAFDVEIRDASGALVVVIENLVLRAVAGGNLRPGQEATSLTEKMLATGIRRRDADEVFARVFNIMGKNVTVAPVPLEQIRLAMAEVPKSQSEDEGAGAAVAISDPLAAALASEWQQLLGVNSIGPDDDFFALGGHSLNAVRLFNRIRKSFGVDMPLAQLYESPTVSALADAMRSRGYVDETAPAETPDAASPGTNETLQARSSELTEGQREVFSAILSNPSANLAYNLSCSLHIDGDINADAMTQALQRVGQRHDSLRATFDPHSLQMTISPDVTFALETADLQDAAPEQQADSRASIHHDVASTEFDLERGPMLRARLLTYAPGRHELLIGLHHMICDGWSIGVIMRDLSEIYNAIVEARDAKLPPIESIVDFVAEEKDWLATDRATEHRDYWLDRFSGDVPVMDLPTDRPRPPVRTSSAERIDTALSASLDKRLRDMAKATGSSLENVVFAAFQLFLSHLTGSRDIVVGLPAAGQLSFGAENTVGHCVNFLPIRSSVQPEESFADLVAQVKRNLLSALDHQNYTYGSLMRDLGIPRDPSRLALVPIIVNIDNLSEIDALPYSGLSTEFKVNPTGNELFEIFFNLLDAPGGAKLYWSYNTDLFNADTIQRYLNQFLSLLEGLAADPNVKIGKTSALLSGSIQPSSGTFEDPGALGPQTITEVFATTVGKHANRIAVRQGDATMDYQTLDARSDALAKWLVDQGVQRGQLVGISSRRSVDLIVAVMGVLKSGAGYVPFDTALPADRLRFMAEDTGIGVLIGTCDPVADTGVKTISLTDLDLDAKEAPKPGLTGEDIAYVMFTSGTTGTPKGVVLPHRTVIRMLCDTDWLKMGPETVTLHSSAFAFDTSIIDIFAALLHGGTVVIPPDGTLSISDLATAVASHDVNTLWLTSGLFHAVADTNPLTFEKVDQVIVGGDVVSPPHVKKVMDACPNITVINGYGPTESNVTNAHPITYEDTVSGKSLPIGKAIPGTQIFIVDEAMNPVPAGIQGELCIAGRGLALGYWNRPDLTAEKFVAAPWDPDLRLYLSGDLAMDPGDGSLRFYGRKDTQVKVRGFRVEPLEIESVLEDHPMVKQVVVVAVVPEGQTDKVLAAFIVPEDKTPSRRILAEHVKTRIPEYARPSFYVPVSELPLNQNGKVDRKALPPLSDAMEMGDYLEPQNATERRLAEMWSDVLKLDTISAEANFFDLGGHSLLAVRLFDKIRAEFSLDLPISTLFQNPSIRDLAGVIDEGQADSTLALTEDAKDLDWDTSTVIHPGPGTGNRPLFIVGGVGGNLNNLADLARNLGKTCPVIGFQTRGILGHTPRNSIEEMAADNITYLKAHQPNGPYIISGYSGGAFTAFEMARQLQAQGDVVDVFFVLDTFAPGFVADFGTNASLPLRKRVEHEVALMRDSGLSNLKKRSRSFFKNLVYRGPALKLLQHYNPSYHRYRIMKMAWIDAARHYEGGQFDGDVLLFKSNPTSVRELLVREKSDTYGWEKWVPARRIQTLHVEGDHRSMVTGKNGAALAQHIVKRLLS